MHDLDANMFDESIVYFVLNGSFYVLDCSFCAKEPTRRHTHTHTFFNPNYESKWKCVVDRMFFYLCNLTMIEDEKKEKQIHNFTCNNVH